jgi:adenosylcobinamide-GDP ribazoletransferase
MFRGLVTAIRTLTSLPAPGRETDRPASALPWFPIVGMFVGLLLYGMHSLAVEVLGIDWAGGTAAAILLLGIGLTRALHLASGARERRTRCWRS